MAGEIKMEALKWWFSLRDTHKIIKNYYPNTDESSLTNKDILFIWKSEMEKPKYTITFNGDGNLPISIFDKKGNLYCGFSASFEHEAKLYLNELNGLV